MRYREEDLPVFLVERKLLGRNPAPACEVPIARDVRKALWAYSRRISRIRVPTRVIETQSDIHDRVIVEHPSTEDPIPRHETSQVTTHMVDSAVTEVGQIEMIADGRGAQESMDRRVHSGGPGVREEVVVGVGESRKFDQVFEV